MPSYVHIVWYKDKYTWFLAAKSIMTGMVRDRHENNDHKTMRKSGHVYEDKAGLSASCQECRKTSQGYNPPTMV